MFRNFILWTISLIVVYFGVRVYQNSGFDFESFIEDPKGFWKNSQPLFEQLFETSFQTIVHALSNLRLSFENCMSNLRLSFENCIIQLDFFFYFLEQTARKSLRCLVQSSGIVALFSPLIGGLFFILLFQANLINSKQTFLGLIFSIFWSFICSCHRLFDFFFYYDDNEPFMFHSLFSWIELGQVHVEWSFIFDSLCCTMMIMVTSISFLVHIYSIEYMKNEKKSVLFMIYLTLFTFFMLVLVSAGNYVQLFVGWEGIGLSSYLLIGFWSSRPSASQSALKALLVNRIGDVGLIFAIVFCYVFYGTTDFLSLYVLFGLIGPDRFCIGYNLYIDTSTIIGLFLIIGVFAKSSQFFFHTWLPDAMEGPTPVSALIHAATLVTAGVFVIVRSSFIFEHSSSCLSILCIFGGLTAIFGSAVGIFQYDIKKIIAYSTCSQLGYMVYACGISDYDLAVFHMFNHAYFKALLFLCAGSIIHSLHDEQDIRKMGGLIFVLPFTCCCMLIGSLSLMGFPFFSGFYSKDVILESSFFSFGSAAAFGHLLILISTFFTSFYSVRLVYWVVFPRYSLCVRKCFENEYAKLYDSENFYWIQYSKDSIIESVVVDKRIPDKFFFKKICQSSFFFCTNAVYKLTVGLIQVIIKNYMDKNFGFFKHVEEPGLLMCLPLFVLSFISIFGGYLVSDLMSGLGTDFWSFHYYYPLRYSQHHFNSEFAFFYIKLVPTLFSFFGALASFFICHYYSSCFFHYSMNSNYFLTFFIFLNRKFFFDPFYNYFLIVPLFKFIYKSILHCVDRGFFEHVLGPRQVFVKTIYVWYCSRIQTGFIYDYATYVTLGVVLVFFAGYTNKLFFQFLGFVQRYILVPTFFVFFCYIILYRFRFILPIVLSFFYEKIMPIIFFFFRMRAFFYKKKDQVVAIFYKKEWEKASTIFYPKGTRVATEYLFIPYFNKTWKRERIVYKGQDHLLEETDEEISSNNINSEKRNFVQFAIKLWKRIKRTIKNLQKWEKCLTIAGAVQLYFGLITRVVIVTTTQTIFLFVVQFDLYLINVVLRDRSQKKKIPFKKLFLKRRRTHEKKVIKMTNFRSLSQPRKRSLIRF